VPRLIADADRPSCKFRGLFIGEGRRLAPGPVPGLVELRGKAADVGELRLREADGLCAGRQDPLRQLPGERHDLAVLPEVRPQVRDRADGRLRPF